MNTSAATLRGVGFVARSTCDTCTHWSPHKPANPRWGSCVWHAVEHERGGRSTTHPATTPRNGHCPTYSRSEETQRELEGSDYAVLWEEDSGPKGHG